MHINAKLSVINMQTVLPLAEGQIIKCQTFVWNPVAEPDCIGKKGVEMETPHLYE